MADMIALRVLRDRDGVDLPDGSIYALTYIHRRAYEDSPVRAFARLNLRRKVTDFAAEQDIDLDGDAVTVAEVSPDELDATWRVVSRNENPMEPFPLHNAYALVGYWTPPEAR